MYVYMMRPLGESIHHCRGQVRLLSEGYAASSFTVLIWHNINQSPVQVEYMSTLGRKPLIAITSMQETIS